MGWEAALDRSRSQYNGVKVSLNEAREEIRKLKLNNEQLRKCQDFKNSYGKKMLEENIKLKKQVKDLELKVNRLKELYKPKNGGLP